MQNGNSLVLSPDSWPGDQVKVSCFPGSSVTRSLISSICTCQCPHPLDARDTNKMNDKWIVSKVLIVGHAKFSWEGRINMKTGTRSLWRWDLKSQQTPGCWRGEYIFNGLQIFSKSNKLGDVNEGMYFEKPDNIFKSQQTWGCLRRKIFSTESLVLADKKK